jgi:hypothetical protein
MNLDAGRESPLRKGKGMVIGINNSINPFLGNTNEHQLELAE